MAVRLTGDMARLAGAVHYPDGAKWRVAGGQKKDDLATHKRQMPGAHDPCAAPSRA